MRYGVRRWRTNQIIFFLSLQPFPSRPVQWKTSEATKPASGISSADETASCHPSSRACFFPNPMNDGPSEGISLNPLSTCYLEIVEFSLALSTSLARHRQSMRKTNQRLSSSHHPSFELFTFIRTTSLINFTAYPAIFSVRCLCVNPFSIHIFQTFQLFKYVLRSAEIWIPEAAIRRW